MSEDEENVPPLTEPVTVNDTFVTGWMVEWVNDNVRITAISHLPKSSGEMDERRIVQRSVTPPGVGRDLMAQLKRLFAKGGH